jgi:hypothetical protein
MSLSPKSVFGKRQFIILAYIPDLLGVPRPSKLLKRCPFSVDGDTSCKICVERWRPRKCGIPFSLAGFHCATHDASFTIYPPGWGPYARRPLVSVDHSGCVIEQEDGESPWSDTSFKAAVDASRGHLWPEELKLGPSANEDSDAAQSRRTQRRHIAGVMRLFGFNIFATTREREIVASLINVGVSRLEEGAKKIREGPNLVVRGLEAVRVLEQLPVLRLMMTGLLTLGENQGYWGPALLP